MAVRGVIDEVDLVCSAFVVVSRIGSELYG